MYATWNFVRKHKHKIVAGSAAVATIYGVKCFLESETFSELVQHYARVREEENQLAASEDCLNEARRHFLFDVHQQSCDKTLNNLIVQLRKRIDAKFDTEALLNELRSSEELTGQRKLEIWAQLKIWSIAKMLSVLTIFPLVTLVLKTQKSIVCQQIHQSLPRNMKKKSSSTEAGKSLFTTGINFVKSFFYEENSPEKAEESSARAQRLFNDSVQFFLTEGIDLLFGLLEKIADDIFTPVQLVDELSAMDLHFLLERARAKLKAIGAANNFSDFVVPTAQLCLQISDEEGKRLQDLLRQFVLILRTQRCRQLMEEFSGKYFESFLQQIDEALPDAKSLPLAKLVPRFCNAFPQLTANDQCSVFFETLTSTDLHQFTLFVSECSNERELGAAFDGISMDNSNL